MKINNTPPNNRIKQMPPARSAIDNPESNLCVHSANGGEGHLLFSTDVCVLNRLQQQLEEDAVQKMEGFSFEGSTIAEAERTGWPTCFQRRSIGLPQTPVRGSLQTNLCCWRSNCLWW
ncbi:hypothetical protein D770_04885 [Flammeovirgaceae bacterium 311]|nr:hypothetical protein D770_04885 [Flammeovirgaceae bacterium 311]